MNFTEAEWFPSRLSFGKFKGKIYQEAREDAELRSWLEWLTKSTNERSSAMGRWYLGQLENGSVLERRLACARRWIWSLPRCWMRQRRSGRW